MFYEMPVDIPQIPGKIIRRKRREIIYIEYQYGCDYLKDKQYTLPRRAVIGKAVSKDSAKMFPNDNFYRYFPEASVPQFRNASDRSCGLSIGAWIMIEKVIKEYGLDRLIAEQVEDKPGLLLDLAAYMIITEDNAAFHYPDYAYRHPLFSQGMTIWSDVTVSRFVHNLTIDQRIGFLNAWNDSRDHRQKIYISYDSTNKNSDAGDVDIAEWGHPKVDVGTKVLNIAIAYDRNNRVPLFYEDYSGSIVDSSEFSFALEKAYAYGYRKIGFILDRGYFSRANIEELDDKGYDFIIMVKGRKKLVADLVMKYRNTFETVRKNYIREFNTYGVTIESPLFSGDEKKRWIHIYYNVKRQAAEQEMHERVIEKARELLQNHLLRDTEFGNSVTDLFELDRDRDGKLLCFTEKEDTIEQLMKLSGYFCIATSSKMTAAEALRLYKSRDESEKLFSGDKSFLGSRSMRTHSTESVHNKIFIEFIALIIRSRIFTMLHDLKVTQHRKVNYLCVPKAIQELEKIEMARQADGIYRLDHAVTATQKTILSAFGMDENDVWLRSLEIGRMLEKAGSAETAEDRKEEEDDYDEDSYDDIY